VTADGLDAHDVKLNGTALAVADDGTLPDLGSQVGPPVLPPHAWAFVRWPDANAAACH
jgi:hypothetical protein